MIPPRLSGQRLPADRRLTMNKLWQQTMCPPLLVRRRPRTRMVLSLTEPIPFVRRQMR